MDELSKEVGNAKQRFKKIVELAINEIQGSDYLTDLHYYVQELEKSLTIAKKRREDDLAPPAHRWQAFFPRVSFLQPF